jgi:hypothetical protein
MFTNMYAEYLGGLRKSKKKFWSKVGMGET